MTQFFYVLEVPHRGEPRVWIRPTKKHAARVVEEGSYSRDCPFDDRDDVTDDDWLEYNQRDLSAQYSGDDETVDLLLEHLRGKWAPRIGQCGPLRAARALELAIHDWSA